MSIAQSLLMEFEQEAATTHRVLERVPGDQLAWQAHPTSMSLGQLALHVAQTPGAIAQMAQADAMVNDTHGSRRGTRASPVQGRS